ncbi:MAG: PAS domain S-box protein [Mariprofundus sp.]|nr:PAS domain S-box protein [Mariprofundus sp.]
MTIGKRGIPSQQIDAESIIATVREPMLVLDAGLHVVSANRSFYNSFHVDEKETEGQRIYDLGNCQWNIPALRKLLEELLPQNTKFDDFEMEHDFPNIGKRTMLLNARRIYKEHEKTQFILLAIEDITERKQAAHILAGVTRALETLSRCNSVLIHAQDESQFLSDICQTIVNAGGYRLAWIGRAEHDQNKAITPVAEAGFDEGYLDVLNLTWADKKRGRGPTGTAIRTKNPSIAQDIRHDPRFAPWHEAALRHGYQSSIALPLIIAQDVYGALNIYAAEPDVFNDNEMCLLQELADDVAYGISVLRTRAEQLQAEEELLQFERIVSTSSDMMALLDKDFIYRSANQAYLDAFNKAPDELIGHSASELFGKEFFNETIRPPAERCLAGEKISYQHWFDFPAYESRYMDINYYPYSGSGNEISGLVVNGRDITKHKQAEERGLALSSILEKSLNEIYIFDAKTLKFIQVNYGARANLGYELDELRNLTPLDLKPEFTKPSFEKLIKPLRAGKKEQIQFTTVHRRKDGSLYPVEVHLQLSTLESQKVFVAIILDITERKKSEYSLIHLQKQTRQIIDSARDAFVSMDSDGNITDWNPQAEETFGWQRKEVLGQPVSKIIIPPELREAHEKGLNHFLTSGEGPVLNQHIEINALHRDGHTFPVELSIVPAHSDDDVIFNAIIRNLSAQAETRKTLKNSLVGTIVAVSKAVEARDQYTAGHQQRVARLARSIAQEIGLDSEQIDGLRMGATIHDIGKIHLPAEILSKPTKLTEIEFELIKTHCQVGYDILKDIKFPWPVAEIAWQHHERLNGSGYPQGLKGDEICLEARIVAVADVVEAISSHRPYRPALGIDVALQEIEKHRGEWFEPAAVDACLNVCRKKGFSFE